MQHQIKYPCRYQPSFCVYQLIHGNVELFSGDLFDRIHPSECIWTLEGPQQITLYIQKNRSGIRWPHLFAVDDAVLETLDDATLTEYTDRLEKYHQQTQTPPLGQRSTVTDGKYEVLSSIMTIPVPISKLLLSAKRKH
ncbi:hypothetical protein BASA81_009988 [Batrachochytrium salamandrivorans]|nr:hypothetical protein BASA81_009988 [Batrachochytrium salamandrivorans]